MKYSSSTLVRTDNVQRYFKDIKCSKYNPLDDSIIRELFADRNKNREQIINANIRLVATIAKSYDNSDSFMDYNQEGIEGLIEAIDRYNPCEEAKFSTYAANWIRSKMSMLCKKINMIQRSNQGKIGSKAIKFQEQFLKENMREATTEEIIEHLSENCGIDVKYANEIFGVKINSINDELDDDGLTPESSGEFAVKTACENNYFKTIEEEDLTIAIGKMLTMLTNKERDFVTRHIINGNSYADIAEDMNCTAERVRQIVVGALKKMKNSKFAKSKFACYLK
jgi:RNA polymerase sigma factor (sigma-70 family)